MLNGIDISSWQEHLNLNSIDTDFVIIKATGGRQYVNPMLDIHYHQAKNKGIMKGLYHFIHESYCKGNAIDEANHFINVVTPYLDGETILVLDNESDNKFDVNYMCEFASQVITRTGIIPLIYMSESVENACNWSPLVKMNVGLWIASYGANSEHYGFGPNMSKFTVKNWSLVAMHQYTSKLLLKGYNSYLDANQFYGSKQAWIKYANPQNKQQAPTPQAQANTEVWHTVKPGECLSQICANYGVSDWQAVARLNKLRDANIIFPNQRLRIK